MKDNSIGKLKWYIFTRVIICALTAGLIAYVTDSAGISMLGKVLLLVTLAACMCLYAAHVITHRACSSAIKCKKELDQISAYLRETSIRMSGTVAELEQNAAIMKNHMNSILSVEVTLMNQPEDALNGKKK